MEKLTVKELKIELKGLDKSELVELCLRLAKFKKENKELLNYLLFESSDEAAFVESVKDEVNELFDAINLRTHYLFKKGVRKILLNIKKYCRYSKNTNTEVELLVFFCLRLKSFPSYLNSSSRLINLYNSQVELINKKVLTLHEDLQYDFEADLKKLQLIVKH